MVRYIYICSAGHSGSTLLDLLIGAHSKAESLGEISQLPKNIALNCDCTCGQPVRSCRVWRNAIDMLSDHYKIDFANDPYALNLGLPRARIVVDRTHQNAGYLIRRRLTLALYYAKLRYGLTIMEPMIKHVEESITNNFVLYDIIRQLCGVNAVVDSSKAYLKAVGVYKRRPDSVRLILLTRDGRGVYYSNLKRKFPKKECVDSWKNHYVRALSLFSRHVDEKHVIRVKYEDLVRNPQKQLERICDFVELEYEPGMLDYAKVTHHSINGNDMRFVRSSEIKQDVSWHEKLSKDDLRYFYARAGALNRELGYE